MQLTLWKFIEPLGLITAFSFGFALLNYVLKYIHKTWIVKLPPEYKDWVTRYRLIMKLVIKYHKLAGLVAVIGLSTHFTVAFSSGLISLSGLISAGLMITIVLLGIYGAFVKKSPKGKWLVIHRLAAAALAASIFIHVVL